nr:nuclear pore complex protein NUP98A isoform X2 [Tanacetum cinerariifolium]
MGYSEPLFESVRERLRTTSVDSSDEEETTSRPEAYALFISRENPRALVIHPLKHGLEKHPLRNQKVFPLLHKLMVNTQSLPLQFNKMVVLQIIAT